VSKLQLILLGHFDCLLSSGERISLSMRKAEMLLAYLALAPGIGHSRERLINLLWSDRSEEQARNSLRQCLSAIRKSLGNSADLILQVDRTRVTLKPELIDVDALEFERLATESDFESLSTAAGFYQGEFLEGVSIRDAAGQEWLDGARARFKHQYIEILANLGHTLLASRDYSAAIKSGEHLVEQDPLGESGWRLLMRSYFEHGDRSHALQAFKRCQQALRDELDVDPEAATIELRDQIATGETEPPPTPTLSIGKIPINDQPSTDHSIVVLPFDNLSGDPEQEYFSDGITDSIILNLSLFPGLNVKSRNSSFAFKQQIKSLGEISQELGVDYVVEGSIRKSLERIRITVQLIEAMSGNQIWGKRYDSDLEDLFNLEEELSRTIAATVTGQIESDLQRIAITKGATGQQSYDLLLSGIYHTYRFNRQDTVIAIDQLNQCLVQDPNNVRAHAQLYTCHAMDYLERWTNDYQASFKHAEEHILKALALNPESGQVQVAYGEFLVFSREFDLAARHLDKALKVNPNDTDALATRALLLEMLVEPEVALETAQRACQLDPYHPWAEWELMGSQYLCGHYEAVLETLSKSRTSPGFTLIFSVVSNIKLDRIDMARPALQVFLQACRESMLSMPQSLAEWFDYTRDNYPFIDPRINQDIIDCLVQAGLEDELANDGTDKSEPDQQPTILVLPFSNMSGDPEQEYFSDGITASIILSLGLFHGISVKSQKSSFAFKRSPLSSTEIAGKLQADYLVEGSIRKSATRVRVSVQLVESTSGNQIWGKQYDEELEDILELEQELSQSIAATISGRIGHKIQQSAVRKPAKDMKSYDYLMRGLYHLGLFTAAGTVIAREQIQKCIDIDPDNALAHTNLAVAYDVELLENWASDRNLTSSLAIEHFNIALQLDPEDALTHAYLAEHLFFLGDFEKAEFHADRAIELNPTASEGYVAKADLLSFSRRADEAISYANQGLQLDPYSVGSGWVAGEAYRNTGQYKKAIKTFRSISHLPPSIHGLIAVCFVNLEALDEARTEMKLYQKLAKQQMPNYPESTEEWRQIWGQSAHYLFREDFNTFFKQLLVAGLCDDLTESDSDLPSIAVLPFENMSGDPEQEFFSDGITTDIISTLSKFSHMRIVARHSTLQYKIQKSSITEIAEQQGVRYILEGSVRKSVDRIRVNAELIDSQNEQICWSEHYDRDLDDLFAVQDEMTKNIALAMKVHLDDGDMALQRSTGTTNIKAWQLTLTAVDLQDTYIRENILEARAMANEAIKLDPGYPYAWIALSWTHWQEAYSGWCESFKISLAEAEKANQHARGIDPGYAEVWSQAGLIQVMKHEPDLALKACRKAVELEPGNAEIQALMAFTLIFVGDYEQARLHEHNMSNLCPILPNWYYLIAGQIAQNLRDLDEAIHLFQRGIEVEPDSPLCRFYLIDAMMEQGDKTGAKILADEIRALDQTVTGKGLVRAISQDKSIRDRFQAHLEKLDLY
jgi:TolB-like protein/DNA-binding SARP family transcriptional activator/Flp pilus assembly protein TadD